MRTRKSIAFVAAAALALALAACGTGRLPGAGSAEEIQTYTYDFSGDVVEVSVDVRDGWGVRFSEGTIRLYDGAAGSDGDPQPVALGRYEDGTEYEARAAYAASCPDYRVLENGVSFTDSAGIQEYVLDLGGDVHYRLLIHPDAEAQEILDRFDAVLFESAPQENRENRYLILVNRTHKLPENWEDTIELQETRNYFDESIRVERTAYEAYQGLQAALLSEGVDIELESSYRSVERQEALWAEYEASYGLDYCKQYVAVPGFSEHHTGFAIDTNLIQKDGPADEAERLEERAVLWAKVHEKMPAYGFILRYPEGKEEITGYAYEPWHMRYVGDPETATEIMEQGITLEEYLGQVEPADATVEYGTSVLYSERERRQAVSVLRSAFDTWPGFEMQGIRYAGDESGSPERVAWVNEIAGGQRYIQCIGFISDFRSPSSGSGAFAPDTEYTDYPWWLARTFGGAWEVVSSGTWS